MLTVEDRKIVPLQHKVAQNCANDRKFALGETQKINELNSLLHLSVLLLGRILPSNVGLAKLIFLIQTFIQVHSLTSTFESEKCME